MINDINVSDNFKLYEFECNDGNNEVKLDKELLTKLQAMRDYLGKPIVITSAYRTPEYNAKVSGVKNSQHVFGKAADIYAPGIRPSELAQVADKMGFTGIGTYTNFVHVDTREYPVKWRG